MQGHIAYPQLARNPIHQAVPRWPSWPPPWDAGQCVLPADQLAESNIHAGTGATNVIPGQVVIDFNFRFRPNPPPMA